MIFVELLSDIWIFFLRLVVKISSILFHNQIKGIFDMLFVEFVYFSDILFIKKLKGPSSSHFEFLLDKTNNHKNCHCRNE